MDCDEVAIADLFLLPGGDASLSLVEVEFIVKDQIDLMLQLEILCREHFYVSLTYVV